MTPPPSHNPPSPRQGFSTAYARTTPRSSSLRLDRSPSRRTSGRVLDFEADSILTHRGPSARRNPKTALVKAAAVPAYMATKARQLLTPRVAAPVLVWLCVLWVVHTYLVQLPLPEWASTLQSPFGPSVHLDSAHPAPHTRGGEDWLDSVHKLYRPLETLPAPEPPFPLLRPTRFLPEPCLQSWFMDGEMMCTGAELGEEDTLDATWLWVNGTDSRWLSEMGFWSKALKVFSPDKHFREQNELVYSMRSVLASLRGHLRTFHLVLYDYRFNLDTDLELLPNSTIDVLENEVQRVGLRRDEDSTEQFGDPGESATEKVDRLHYANFTSHFAPRSDIAPSDSSPVSDDLAQYLRAKWRVVQTPNWLNFSTRDIVSPYHPKHDPDAPRDVPAHGHIDHPNLRYAAHSEIFHLPTVQRDAFSKVEDDAGRLDRRWRQAALPTFNSMSIESRLGWLPGLADVSIALNDDFFILKPLAVSDFHSPLYGNVIRFSDNYFQQVKPRLDRKNINDAGEGSGLEHANFWLSKRFPNRKRPYFEHAPKVITRSLHHEANIMFSEALSASSTRKFRETFRNQGDIQIQWLLTALRVERWREALLWTYAVAHLGTDGQWNDYARDVLSDMFDVKPEETDVVGIDVERGERWTTHRSRMDRSFTQAGWEAPRGTEFRFSSLDGHLPEIIEPGRDQTAKDKCHLDFAKCFGTFWTDKASIPADEMFKRLAFDQHKCGDCLVMALVTASGPLGLSAFFPPADTTYTNPSQGDLPHYLPPPHLPLTSTWQEADFSLAAVMNATSLPGETVNLHTFCMRLLSRYLYNYGHSNVKFRMLKKPPQAKTILDELDQHRDTAILGLNDDIVEGYDEVNGMLADWFQSRWPDKAVWERGWAEEQDLRATQEEQEDQARQAGVKATSLPRMRVAD